MLLNDENKYRIDYKLPLLILMVFALTGIFSHFSQAQDSYRNLVLSDQHKEHYLSPYLTRYTQKDQIQTIRDIISKPFLQSEVLSTSSSIVLLNLSDDVTWLKFDVINRSSQEDWNIDFGTSYQGRFGFFDAVNAFTVNPETSQFVEYNLAEGKNVKIKLTPNQKSQVVLRLEKAESLPVAIPFKLLDASKPQTQNLGNLFWISAILLIGMAFFFAAVAIIKYNYSYLFFSLYYLCLTALLFTQNHCVIFDWLFIGSEIEAYMLFAIATISLIMATFFWHPEDKIFWTKPVFFIPIAIGISCIIAGHFVTDSNNLLNFFLLVGPSILILLLIPLISIMQGEDRSSNTTPFMLGWFIFLFGICISILALSGISQPVSTAINAYWFTLIPQAIFFIIAARINIDPENENITLSKVLEINESEAISKLRQSKENTEQERLLKVIEQERKVLGELRKSEARRTEEMRKAKEVADEANKGKSAFLAVVSHEIRTPMTGIMGMVRMLLNSNLTKEQNEYAQTIQDSSDAMLALLNDILDFEKIEQGKMTLENISFDLHRLIQGVATLMNGHAVQKGIELTTKIGDELPNFVMGDPTRLRQVLLNLTGNAIKFTEKGGVKITVELMKKNNNAHEIYFSITDNGIGISEEAKKDLFSPFSQADKTISRKFGGTGLGLAISKGLVSNMGSEINVSSVEGEGSTFFFTLSMDAGNKNMQPPPIQPTSDKIKIQNILLIDDNNINRKVVHGLLSDLPYTIDDEENAEDGLKKLENNNFDLVLMDIELPGMNGDEAAQKIRSSSDAKIKDIPIIAITGNTQDEHANHYYDCGINSVVAKPIDPSTLIKTIDNAAKNIFDCDKKKPFKNQSPNEITIKPKSPLDKPVNLKLDDGTSMPETKEMDKTENPSLPKIKPIIETPPKKGPVFTGSSIDVKQPVIKNEIIGTSQRQEETETLDIEILESLKKHLSLEKINEMIEDVLKTTDDIVTDLKSAMEENSTDIISAKCHDLKGMAGNFGLKEISEIAKEIEQKAKTQPAIIITALIDGLPDAKKRARKALSQWSSSDNNLEL